MEVKEAFLKTNATLSTSLNSEMAKILDLGVSTEMELLHLLELYPKAEVTMVRQDSVLKELADKNFPGDVKIVSGSVFETDFGKDYDAVISNSSLHELKKEEKETLYKKVYDCLKDDGIFVNCDEVEEKDAEVKILKDTGFEEVTAEDAEEKYSLIKAKK